jgi:hypothetical protein
MRKHYGKFISDVQTNGNRRRLGSFATAEEAALCRARHIGAKQASAETQKADVWKLDSVMNGNFESLVNDQFFSDLNVTPLASAAAAGRPTVPVAAPGLCLDAASTSVSLAATSASSTPTPQVTFLQRVYKIRSLLQLDTSLGIPDAIRAV